MSSMVDSIVSPGSESMIAFRIAKDIAAADACVVGVWDVGALSDGAVMGFGATGGSAYSAQSLVPVTCLVE